MSDPVHRCEHDGPRKPDVDPKTWAGATRQCGKCGARKPIRGSVGSKVHRFWGWICGSCANPNPN